MRVPATSPTLTYIFEPKIHIIGCQILRANPIGKGYVKGKIFDYCLVDHENVLSCTEGPELTLIVVASQDY